jgi:hypothetical protein
VAESCTICSSRFRRPVRKLLDTPSCDITIRNTNLFLASSFSLAVSVSNSIGSLCSSRPDWSLSACTLSRLVRFVFCVENCNFCTVILNYMTDVRTAGYIWIQSHVVKLQVVCSSAGGKLALLTANFLFRFSCVLFSRAFYSLRVCISCHSFWKRVI